MSADALFQLGNVPVALNTSQTEEQFGRAQRRCLVRARAALLRFSRTTCSPRRLKADPSPLFGSFRPGRYCR